METVTAEGVMGQVRGFMESRIVMSGAELNLFGLLAPEPLDADAVVARTGGDRRALTILLDALTSLGYLQKTADRYQTTPEAASLLAADAPESILSIILHYANMWKRWSRLTDIALGAPSEEPAVATRTEAQLRAFIGGMHVVSSPRAARIVDYVQPGTARALLDVGGASGTYTLAFLETSPAMRATVFDLPKVIEMAAERVKASPYADRVRLVAGDYNTDELPGGHDLAFLSAIIHQNSHAENVALYGRCFRALDSGGRIVIRDHVMSPDRTSPRAGAIFAVNMLCGTSGGTSYTLSEIEEGLREAGFVRPRLLSADNLMDGLVEAWKP